MLVGVTFNHDAKIGIFIGITKFFENFFRKIFKRVILYGVTD